MIKKGGKTAITFEKGQIATLFIPLKMRLKTESLRLPVRVYDRDDGHWQYSLLSEFGLLKGRYQGGELNPVDDSTELGNNIPNEPIKVGSKEVIITLAKAVAQTNNRGSISSIQKEARKKKANIASNSRNLTAIEAAIETISIASETATEAATEAISIASNALELATKRGRKRKEIDTTTMLTTPRKRGRKTPRYCEEFA